MAFRVQSSVATHDHSREASTQHETGASRVGTRIVDVAFPQSYGWHDATR